MVNTYLPEGSLIGSAENAEYLSSLSSLERAMQEGKILESTVLLCDSQMRLHLDLGGIHGIIEKNECVWKREDEAFKDIAIISRVGKPVCFKVLEIRSDGERVLAVLSRRAAQKEAQEHAMKNARAGDIIPCTVTHMESFGAFVDIGCGVASLLSVDSISVSRISHPQDRITIGERIFAVVKSIDRERQRIFVSMRELLGTWEENAAAFESGQTVVGIVRSVEDYGVFVELAPNLAGLAELRDNSRDAELARPGEAVAVYIKSIIPERMKIKLVLIDRYSCEALPKKVKYYIDGERVHHISSWRYSPYGARKQIESIFE